MKDNNHNPQGPHAGQFSTHLVDAEAIARPLGVNARTVRNWAASNKIPTALRVGKVLRFDPVAVAQSLGLDRQ